MNNNIRKKHAFSKMKTVGDLIAKEITKRYKARAKDFNPSLFFGPRERAAREKYRQLLVNAARQTRKYGVKITHLIVDRKNAKLLLKHALVRIPVEHLHPNLGFQKPDYLGTMSLSYFRKIEVWRNKEAKGMYFIDATTAKIIDNSPIPAPKLSYPWVKW